MKDGDRLKVECLCDSDKSVGMVFCNIDFYICSKCTVIANNNFGVSFPNTNEEEKKDD